MEPLLDRDGEALMGDADGWLVMEGRPEFVYLSAHYDVDHCNPPCHLLARANAPCSVVMRYVGSSALVAGKLMDHYQ